MSAKKSKRPVPTPAAPPVPVPTPVETAAPVAWIDSDDPKKRQWAKIILVVVWLYVGALFLLALDQTFKWGIFGP